MSKAEEHYEVTIEALFAQARSNVAAAGFSYAQAYRTFGAEQFWAYVAKCGKNDVTLNPKLLWVLLKQNGIDNPMMPVKSVSQTVAEPAREKALKAFLALPEIDKDWMASRMQEIANELV